MRCDEPRGMCSGLLENVTVCVVYEDLIFLYNKMEDYWLGTFPELVSGCTGSSHVLARRNTLLEMNCLFIVWRQFLSF